jgi:ABC-2 type transport system ATP-binding protein
MEGPPRSGQTAAFPEVDRAAWFVLAAACSRDGPGLRRQEPCRDVAKSLTMMGSASAIETERLSKRYPGDRGILGLDLAVEYGEVFGFLGPNGAGKTTTIRLLLDLIRPTAGGAQVLGRDTRRDSLAIRRRVGYLPGELSLYGRLTGQETLRYFASLRGGVDWSYVGELGERLDCDLTRRNAELSSGNRRKLGLVQALMHRPELLILDEPTGGLDPLVQHEFHDLMTEARAAGQSVFLSSHVLPEVQRVCDRVAFIREARLIAVESVDDLVRRAVREVEVTFAGEVPAARFAIVPGVTVLGQAGADLRLTVAGSMDPLVKALAAYGVVSLTSREPDLEDVFLTYYGEAGADASA